MPTTNGATASRPSVQINNRRRLKTIAPGIGIHLGRIAADTSKLLESGDLDLAVGFILPMGAGFCQQRLFKERFICAVRKGHPRIENSDHPGKRIRHRTGDRRQDRADGTRGRFDP